MKQGSHPSEEAPGVRRGESQGCGMAQSLSLVLQPCSGFLRAPALPHLLCLNSDK